MTADKLDALMHSQTESICLAGRRQDLKPLLEVFPPSLLSLDLTRTTVSEGPLDRILMRCSRLTSLNLSRCSLLGANAIHSIATYCTNVRFLNLSYCGGAFDMREKQFRPRISSEAFVRMVDSCGSNLKYLNLAGQHTVGDDLLKSLARNCSDLVSLHISVKPSQNITPEGFELLASTVQLKKLVLGNYIPKILHTVATHMPYLESFVQKETNVLSKFLLVEAQEGCLSVVRSCTKLRSLALPGCFVDNSLLTLVSSLLTSLTTLKINGIQSVTEVGLISLGLCTALRHLEIITQTADNCKNDKTIGCLSSKCPHLTHLDLGKSNLTDSGLRSLSRFLNLEHLSLDALVITPDNHSKESLMMIASNCLNLTEISFNWVDGMTEQILIQFATCCPNLAKLKCLFSSFRQNPTHLTSSCLFALSNCRNLRSLALSDCQDFSEGIRCLARSCKRLKKLVFTFSSRLDDKTVNDVLDNCKFLTDLHLHGRGMCFSQATLSRCRRTLVAFQAVTS
eukprot:TRINITY_DN1532_c0_g1_i15.p1 TRINITY_DN1532_c0_g1~~TRINITY_DN1532_c0_g1_i15.p1  ORF type:complete len:510 (+),score=87.69 TRINITY_DN1532_c0_g1_i15:245-1774(+)